MATNPETIATNEEDSFKRDLGFPGPAVAVDIPPSEVANADSDYNYTNPSDQDVDEPGDAMWGGEMFPAPFTPAVERPMTSSMIALVRGSSTMHPALAASEANIALAQNILDSNQEYSQRIKVAFDRRKRQVETFDKIVDQIQNSDVPLEADTAKSLKNTREQFLMQSLQDDVNIALEQETVETIQDLLTAGNTTEAKVTWDLYNKGDAVTVMHENAVKNFIMGQRIQELEAEYANSGWGRTIGNFLLGMVPTSFNFSRSGILDDAEIGTKATSTWNFFLAGSGLDEQGDSLWSLPLRDFAEAMKSDGTVMKAIRDNAGTILDDPGLSLELLEALNLQSESDKNWNNAWGIVDPATLVPWGKAGSVAKNIARLGARESAAARVADAYEVMIQRGEEAAKRATAIDKSEVVANLEPTALNGIDNNGALVPLSSDVSVQLDAAREALKDLGDFIVPSRFTNEDELAAAFEKRVNDLKEDIGERAKDYELKYEDLGSGISYDFQGLIPEQGRSVFHVDVVFGKKAGGGYASEKLAANAMRTSGYPGEVFRDGSGQYFWRSRFNVREEGFITTDLNSASDGAIKAAVRAADRTSDRSAISKALQAENVAAKVQSRFHTALTNLVKKLPGRDLEVLTQVLKKGQNTEQWFDEDQLRFMWTNVTGEDMPQSALDAYHGYRTLNDVEYLIRDEQLYANLARQGAEGLNFTIGKGGFKVDRPGMINTDPKKVPIGNDIWDASKGAMLSKPDAELIQTMSNEGYVMVKLVDPVTLPNGEAARFFMIKNTDLARGPLRRGLLGYSAGGHRAYTGSHFVKQTMRDAKQRLINPNVFITGNNKNVLGDWAQKMNEARLAAKEGRTADWIDENVFLGERGFPTGDEFLKEVEAGRINLDEAFEVTLDRELPKAYQGLDSTGLQFVNTEESSFEGYTRTNGRMYYSRKGEHLRNAYGELADTVDPWEALNTALDKITRDTSLHGYKTNVLERFRANYAAALDTTSEDLYGLVNANIKPSVTDRNLIRKIKNEQSNIRHILGFETKFEKWARESARSVSEAALGEARGGLRELAHNHIYWDKKNNPVNFLRSLAFDVKLGLFNFGQVFIQTSTMWSALALSPRYGMQGMYAAGLLMPRTVAKNTKWSVLDVLAKRGSHKLMGFDTPEQMKDFAKLMDNTGILNVDNTHAQLQEYGSNAVFGFTSKAQGVRDAGRTFFYAAEKMNRIAAARIAYGEAVDAGLKPGTANFREAFLRRANDYSFNMMNSSAAKMQRGAAGIPTQFWGYSFRMMDALLGKTFTPQQRVRLFGMQVLLGGAFGIPLGDLASDFIQRNSEQQVQIGTPISWVERGVVDNLIYAATGADIAAGEKLATASLFTDLVKDFFSLGEYGPKSLAEWTVGATGSIATSLAPTLVDVAKYAIAESGGEGGYPVTIDLIKQIGLEVSTANYATRAYYASKYGTYSTKKGDVLASDLPPASAFFIAMGFQPEETNTLSFLRAIETGRNEALNDTVKLMNRWRQEAFSNPDKYQENIKKVNSLMQMADPADRVEIIKRLNRVTDPSMLDKIERQHYEREAEEAALQAGREALGLDNGE